MRTALVSRTARMLCAGTLLFAAACDGEPTGLSGSQGELLASVRAAALPLTGAASDYDPLMQVLDGRRFALLGESTHGTREFYQERARISQRLIAEQEFAAVIVEGEWADAQRADRYVRGAGPDASAAAALGSFNQFPLWMWRNQEFAGFIQWLRTHNAARPAAQRVGFYGMDVYGLAESLREVARILEEVDFAAAEAAISRYACFGSYLSPDEYGRAVADGAESCAEPAADQFAELHARWTAAPGDEALFHAMQNARVVMGAEQYFRTIYRGGRGWDLRDRHMTETVAALSQHLQARGLSGRVVVWAHNSHVGDARAMFLGSGIQETLGRLMRERFGAQVGLVGFTTYSGSVIAARGWGQAGEVREVMPALEGSWEEVFHAAGASRFLLLTQTAALPAMPRDPPPLQRAIGVSYHPETERTSHYFRADLANQFDAVIHIDQTTALTPLAQ
ncbi:MAG TPA: erythromycin esterase family protein [Longimicrobium sp.]|nr:erythromycin esterase family protein [Longimicrobium sp.]